MKKKVTKLTEDIESRLTSVFTREVFIGRARDYIMALKEGRLCCVIVKRNQQNTSRQVRVFSLDKVSVGRYNPYYYTAFIQMLGYNRADENNILRGCGFDTVRDMNEDICRQLHDCGILNAEEFKRFSVMSIHVV